MQNEKEQVCKMQNEKEQMCKMQAAKLCLTFAPGRQQSPPSYPQPMLLFPRSQRPSPTYKLTL